MEREVFVKIINAILDIMCMSNGLNEVLPRDVDLCMPQIYEIVDALEIQFEDDEKWISWWLFDSGEKKEFTKITPQFRPVKNVEDMWEIHEPQEVKIELPTAGDLYDWLDWNMANS